MPLYRVHPDTSGAEDDDGVTRLRARRHRRRSPPGGDAARHQGRRVERNRVIDLDGGIFRHHGILGEGPELGESHQIVITQMATRVPSVGISFVSRLAPVSQR
ncbi:hypothetical protein I553_8489 [Mycobacterium xenopi 4042]|uniref:Uncharacterized protein n=1 Tax=Mycobacterium xenopi 4042 TaxID=1299334 RepID=X8CKS8_MYCXE|nr:hypothetical protein I553_8489 [Mycobacterium xenopi 4042]